MNRKIHLILVLGCVLIAVLDAPRASRLFSEGLAGPYEESARVRAAPPQAQGDARSQRRAPAGPTAPLDAPATKPATQAPAAVLLNSGVQIDPNGDDAR